MLPLVIEVEAIYQLLIGLQKCIWKKLLKARQPAEQCAILILIAKYLPTTIINVILGIQVAHTLLFPHNIHPKCMEIMVIL